MRSMRARLLGILLIIALPLVLSRARSEDGGLIVALKNGRSAAALNRSLGIQVVRQIQGAPIYLVRTDGDSDDALKNIRADGNVDLAEKNGSARLTWGDESTLDPAIA